MKELLAVIDMQNDFISGALGTKEAQEIVPNVCRKIESWQGDIIMTRDTHTEEYMDTAEGKMLPIPHCICQTDGWQINEDVLNSYAKTKSAESGHFFTIVDKPTFGSTVLAFWAEMRNYDRVVICGLCTDICVLSNAMLLRAALPEAEIIVDASCCAGVTPASHKAALDAMAPCNIKIINK